MSQPWVLDSSSFSNELRFLLRLLRSDNKLEAEEAVLLAHELDWPLFLRFVVYHETYPILYPLLVQLNAKQQWTPEFVMARLRALYTRNTMMMLQLRGEMERVNGLLNDRRVRSLFLKGPVLAAMLYGDVSGRTSGDLDILVAKQDWDASVQQLLSAGYVLAEQYEEEEVLNNTERKTHHVSYVHREKSIEVELHWSLNPDTVTEPSFEELWARRQASPLHKSVFTLGNEDLLVYLVLHGTRHGWSSLKWLLDIDRMMNQFLNWNRTNQLFDESGSRMLGGEAFLLATQLLGTLLPEEAHAMTLEPKAMRLARMVLPFIREELILYPKPERKDIAVLFNRYLLATMSPRQKLLYVTNKLYPSSKDRSVLPLPRSLHFLYFPLRPFLWFWRQVKRQAPKEEASS
ncbi:nucleotidyltransferase domain-containing protein [Paenibacillus sp. MMO-58]|uniref:nucleotidyltransferase domain-containing protein n=1 Tax=Paenibacillus sp. MMO-58 TaxID=3081290 RepID=UPI0030178761